VNHLKSSAIKREQKKSFLLREISRLIYEVGQEESVVRDVFVTRVDLSADTGICYVYFSTAAIGTSNEEVWDKALEKLKLYKPSMRSKLSKSMHSRYTPDLLFLFDEKQEKIQHLNSLLDQVHQEFGEKNEKEEEEDDSF
jgi:ribosome-binding factor A